MNSGAQARSRRELFTPHLAEPQKLKRCLVCQWAIDQDHDEALQLEAAIASVPESQGEATEDLVVVGFALV